MHYLQQKACCQHLVFQWMSENINLEKWFLTSGLGHHFREEKTQALHQNGFYTISLSNAVPAICSPASFSHRGFLGCVGFWPHIPMFLFLESRSIWPDALGYSRSLLHQGKLKRLVPKSFMCIIQFRSPLRIRTRKSLVRCTWLARGI